VNDEQKLQEMHDSNSDFNQSKTLIGIIETRVNSKLRALAYATDKMDKIRDMPQKVKNLKLKHCIQDNINSDLERLQDTFKSGEDIYSSLEKTGLPVQQIMKETYEEIKEKLLSTRSTWDVYIDDNEEKQTLHNEVSKIAESFEGQYIELLKQSQSCDTNLANSGKRPKSNLDYKIWDIE